MRCFLLEVIFRMPRKMTDDEEIISSEEEMEDDKRRNFKIVPDSIHPPCDPSIFTTCGRAYHGKMPMQAGKKAYTKITHCRGDEGTSECVFSIQETTRGSTRKIFTYCGRREVLDPPQKIQKKGKCSVSNKEKAKYLAMTLDQLHALASEKSLPCTCDKATTVKYLTGELVVYYIKYKPVVKAHRVKVEKVKVVKAEKYASPPKKPVSPIQAPLIAKKIIPPRKVEKK